MPGSKQITNKSRYKVVPRTLVFVFDEKERVLLVKGAPDKKLWSGLMNGIGGHVEQGEDILEAARRELKEETGLSETILNYCGQIMIDIERDLGVALFLFWGQSNNEMPVSSAEGNVYWIELADLKNEPVVEDLPILIPKIYQCIKGGSFIIGKYEYDQAGKLKIFFE